MPEQFDHYSYDSDKPAWEQRRVGGYSSSVPPEGGWMAIPTLLGWLNIISGVVGLLGMSFGVVFVVLAFGGVGAVMLPLIAGGAFVVVISLFYLRLGQGLIRREEWSRWVTIAISVLGILATPLSGISMLGSLDDPEMATLPETLQTLVLGATVGGFAVGILLNVFLIYVLVRQDVAIHFRSDW